MDFYTNYVFLDTYFYFIRIQCFYINNCKSFKLINLAFKKAYFSAAENMNEFQTTSHCVSLLKA